MSNINEVSKEMANEDSKQNMLNLSKPKAELEGDYRIDSGYNEQGKKIRKYVRTKKLTSEQLKEIKEAFRLFDKDNSKTIDVAELRDAMKALGINMSKHDLKQMMKNVDKDGTGDIDFDEFKDLMTEKMSERNPEEELKKSFRLYDSDDTGYITFENLKEAGANLGEDLTDDEIWAMIREADQNGDGQISLTEFIDMMKKAKFF